ncbi:hypothetical protein D3C80_488700 [compost metagenome]
MAWIIEKDGFFFRAVKGSFKSTRFTSASQAWKYIEIKAAKEAHVPAATDVSREVKSSRILKDAAPELLEALKDLYLSLVENDEDGLVEHVEPMRKALAAINNAEGRSR